MDDELGGEIAPGAGDDGGADGQVLLETQAIQELRSTDPLEPPDRWSRGVEAGCRGPDDRVGLQEREIVHDHADHLPGASRERRYICVASSGRMSRSSTIPRPYSARRWDGSSATARS